MSALGKTVSVDALTTGYAFLLLDLLKRAGLKQADYKIEKAVGVLARWEALKEKKHDATMLITPFDIFARNAGLNVLQYAISVYGHYQGLCGATRRQWAASNPRLVEAHPRLRRWRGFTTQCQPQGLCLRPTSEASAPDVGRGCCADLCGHDGSDRVYAKC